MFDDVVGELGNVVVVEYRSRKPKHMCVEEIGWAKQGEEAYWKRLIVERMISTYLVLTG